MDSKQYLRLFILFIFFLLQSVDAQSQITVQQKATLTQLSNIYSIEFQQAKAAAIKRADSLGIPVRQEFDNGKVMELMRFVNGRPIYATTYNADGAALINTDELYSGGAAGLDLSGSGQTLGIWDAGTVRNTHDELTGRVTVIDTPNINNHTTRVAGTMIASGVDSDAKGMAPSALLNSYDWSSDQSEMSNAASLGLKLSVHPYGYISGWVESEGDWYWYGDPEETEDYSFGFYDASYAEDWDIIAYDAPNYLIVNSAGNQRGDYPPSTVIADESYYVYDGGAETFVLCSDYGVDGCNNNYEEDGGTDGYDSISYNGLAKNIITVGSVDNTKTLSSDTGFGPTDDGRIKPDIVAKGVSVYSTSGSADDAYSTGSGTSYSAPMIGGSVGLLLEHQENLHPGETLLSSTIKALILHSAEDLGNTGPDYQYGWGLMDTQQAAEIMSLNSSEEGLHIIELTLNDSQALKFSVKAKTTGSEPLRVTMAWTDPAGSPVSIQVDPTDPMLVNDLDVVLEDESLSTYQPYILDPFNPADAATTGDNFRDNIEMVSIDSPTPGEVYTVNINHKGSLSGSSQDFSLIITGNEGVDYQQLITEGAGEGWRFISSPVATTYQTLLDPLWTQGPDNSDYAAASDAESNVRLFDGLTNTYPSVSDLDTSMPIGSGVGVLVYEDDNYDGSPDGWGKTITATGLETLENVDVSDMLSPGSDVFSLIGNPYASTIDFDEFTNQNQVGGSVYVYDNNFNEGDFRVWNGSTGSLSGGLIAPFQGFFVYATGASPQLTIPRSSIAGTSADFYKEAPKAPVVHISAELNESYASDTWFSFTESGSLEKNEKDAPYIYPLDYKPFLSLRSQPNQTGYIIKNLPQQFQEPIQIPLALEAWQPNGSQDSPGYQPMSGVGELTWPELQNISPHWTITLTDHETGTITDLKKSSRYSFTLAEPKAKVRSLPYEMKLNMADSSPVSSTRFTLTIYPEPLAQNPSEETPSEFKLGQNYPNPFNPTTVIHYTLPQSSVVELDVFTIDGQKVATLVSESQNAGNHTVTFDGSNLSSGVYIYRLNTGQQLVSRKMVLVK